MTINGIENELAAKIADLKLTYGADATLSVSDNTAAADELAGILETVNPNHDFPPTPR